MTTTPPTPALTPHTNAAPCPRIEVLIATMPGDAVTITVYRSWSGRKAAVRDANGAPVSGDFLVIDYEAPLGVPVSYSCVTTDVSGIPSSESALSTPSTLSVVQAWVQDPLDPSSAMPIGMNKQQAGIWFQVDSFSQLSYGLSSSVSEVIGSGLPLGIAGTRQQASAVPLQVKTRTPGLADQFRDLLAQAYPLCLRTPVKLPVLDGLTYLDIPVITEAPVITPPSSTFTMTVQAIQGPGLDVVVPVRTWDDVATEGATWNDIAALYSTWIDVQRG
ncbi:hypothetical protein SAMN05892883_2067 [Jatrophihabitans sp. GAS493]|uniref:hypothetical protein n=1 Tax=Jatrophihabitans sp. GAS493 TaxID=1907575 RepID=UPI000BB945F1|nr:hypothetical protein [Jatrophihabitans sp. GAS493]SOD72717.1 hypothetical protein SAMN05892883_2067 [Jatrophihabitans sp. GAS493]